ncbi:MAG: hypothetical protein WCY19_04895 [Candidatus Gastranaerophilaceae bacterium]
MSKVINDPQIILALLKVSSNLIGTVENINMHLDMSNPIDCLLPQVHTKNIFENCRSALDYIACFLVKRYSIDISEDSIYFPFKKTEETFEKQKIVIFLKEQNEKLYEILKEIQPFNENSNFDWLKTFIELNNKYKHQGFIPLERRFENSEGGYFAMPHGADCGIVTLNLTEENTGETKIITTNLQEDRSVKFKFIIENEEELIPLLRKIIDGTYSLIDSILKNI